MNMFAYIIIVFAILIYIAMQQLLDAEYTTNSEYSKHHDMETIHTFPILESFNAEKASYNFGRYRHILEDMNLHELTPSQIFMQKKQFVWSSVANNDWFIGSAVFHFGYTSGILVYVYDIRQSISHQIQIELPIVGHVLGASFNSNTEKHRISPLNGCATFDMLGVSGSKCYFDNRFVVKLKGQFKDQVPFDIQYYLDYADDDSMSLVFPIGPKRASVVNKLGGVVATEASMVLNGVSIELKDCLGLMDYTRGLLRRFTLWHWTAMTWYSDAISSHGHGESMNKRKRYGLQLSEGTYDNNNNVSLESTLWVDGTAHHINIALVYTQLDVSLAAQFSNWTVKSVDNITIDLTFVPSDSIVSAFHYYIIDGDLYHIWGRYYGTIRNSEFIVGESMNESLLRINGVPGTLEDHYAIW